MEILNPPQPGLASVFLINTRLTEATVTAGMEFGVASVGIFDPSVYVGASGQRFQLTYGLVGGDFSLQALLDGPGVARSSVSTTAGSNLPGLDTFFSLSLSLDGSNPAGLDVFFNSNPLLGLNDVVISDDIRSHLAFEPTNSRYSLDSDFNYLTFSVTVPIGQDTAIFSWNTSALAEAGVPEPSNISLFGIGILGLLSWQMVLKANRLRKN
jgi:hypothetical protein